MKRKTVTYNKTQKMALLLPGIAALIGSLILVAAFFMPLATATGEYREYLEQYADEINTRELNMTNEDAIDVSIYEFGRIYRMLHMKLMPEMTVVTMIFSCMTLLLALFRKPIGILIFNGLSFVAYRLVQWDLELRGMLPGKSYDYGTARWWYIIGAVVGCVSAVWLLVVKIRIKKEIKLQYKNNIVDNIQ